MWLYRTKVGIFWIRSKTGGGFLLGIDDELLGGYETPEKAAEAVFRQRTGFPPWDSRIVVVHPKKLDEWQAEGRSG